MQYSQGLVLLTGLAAAGFAYAQAFTANTPASLTQCRPVQLTWTGGQAPYFPRITAPGDINTVLKDFGQVDGNSLSWTVDQPEGQTVTFSVGDSAGNTANSGITPPILAGSASCLNGGAAGGSSSAAPSGSSSAAPSSSSASASSSMSSSAAASSSSARPSSSAASSSSASRPASSSAPAPSATQSSAPNSAASTRGASAVVAGVVGVAVAALL
ncbi:uncharacterized protein PSFLO_07358 [Pseudozyma flocculosa]|uniref:Uncharacterized protein n=1 Tax=Pseudozyma flocculosa TaxID=84751 RepID=A0A5C3FCJ9_9BASI|nr:uncharacterized protein PSFLO_07358 [Pseudozyma flocculosa]